MRRADRLFQIILHLRSRKFATARNLAQVLEVSERTIYRDINDLYCCGVPIDGEAGVGYRLRRGFDLPPLMFDRDELEALRLGARMVKTWADPELAQAAAYALTKIEAVLPEDMRQHPLNTKLYVPGHHPYPVALMTPLRHAIDSRFKIELHYTRLDSAHSTRTVWPLGLFFWGSVWTLNAWCELRDDFRNFRLDRINALKVSEQIFEEMPGRTLNDFLRTVGCDDGGRE
ncbi:MAG: YafY family transcriptional regulator [Candidatus Competibacteraceae bacterium]|nr:YafY family transcriptional regulator [Candidatus Competibacteraceae bacterium]